MIQFLANGDVNRISGEFDDVIAIDVPTGMIVTGNNPKILRVLGLGSCVAVTFYSPEKKIGAMAHVVLPSSLKAKTPEIKGKYANTAIKRLVTLFKRKKVKLEDIEVKITGGSNMLASFKSDIFDVGKKNIKAVKEELSKNNLKISGQNVGGNRGRTIYFHTKDGHIDIFTSGRRIKKVI